MADVFKKIDDIKNELGLDSADQSALDTLKAWEKDFRKAMSVNKLFENPAMKEFVQSLTRIIGESNRVLLEDKNLTEGHRARLMDMRDMYRRFVRLFSDNKSKAEQIERDVEKSLEDLRGDS